MIDFLYSIDKFLFVLCNQTLANPFFDAVMPVLTDLNKTWYGLGLFVFLWVLLMWKGGKKGRVVGILFIPLIVMSDQLSSTVLKNIFVRARPCHEINGVPVIDHIRLLVDCGSGFSFPSSHAANNFAVATLFSYYYRKSTWAIMSFATVVGFSRISVGVHYPSDVLGGAVVGALCAMIIILFMKEIGKVFPSIQILSDRLSIPDTKR